MILPRRPDSSIASYALFKNIQEHLLQLLRIAHHGGSVSSYSSTTSTPWLCKIIAAQLGGLPQDELTLHQFALHRTLARKTQQILHDVFGALGFLQNDLQILASVMRERPDFPAADR